MSFLTSREKLSPHGIGKSIPRREDARLLTGGGQYADDISLPGQVHAYLLRSPHAHASILKIDMAEAVRGPGVIAVLTGSDAAADGLRPIPHSPVPTNPHEVPLRNREITAVPKSDVRFRDPPSRMRTTTTSDAKSGTPYLIAHCVNK